MTKLTCRGYAATVEADPDTGFLHGEVTNAGALLTIAGCSMDEVKAAFEETIADYEQWCRERNKALDAPCNRKAPRTAHRRLLAKQLQ